MIVEGVKMATDLASHLKENYQTTPAPPANLRKQSSDHKKVADSNAQVEVEIVDPEALKEKQKKEAEL